MIGFWRFRRVLEELGSSGRLVGSIPTYPGTCKCRWSRVVAKNLPGGFSIEYGIIINMCKWEIRSWIPYCIFKKMFFFVVKKKTCFFVFSVVSF